MTAKQCWGRAVVSIVLGFLGGFFGTYLGYKHEWPASSVLVFAVVGFFAGFGGGYLLALRALKAL
jgi:drug/metabolite transporter (DMT)-like permease